MKQDRLRFLKLFLTKKYSNQDSKNLQKKRKLWRRLQLSSTKYQLFRKCSMQAKMKKKDKQEIGKLVLLQLLLSTYTNCSVLFTWVATPTSFPSSFSPLHLMLLCLDAYLPMMIGLSYNETTYKKNKVKDL